MNRSPETHPENPSALIATMHAVVAILDKIPQSLISLAARIFPAAVFWMSGQTKVEGFHVTDNAIALFRDEYRLPLIDPVLAATIAAFSEHFFPVLLVIGLASRLSALALLAMTAVIEIFVYPDAWPTHGVWATCFLVVIARGPGIFSLDHLIARRFAARGEKRPNRKAVWVLDRPNPAGPPVEGLTLRTGWQSFVGAGPLPMRHGLTLGELGLWFIRTPRAGTCHDRSGQMFDRLAMPGRTPQLRTSNTACQQKAQHDRRDDGRVAGAPLADPGSGQFWTSLCRRRPK
jgi:putative oxidoreductase